MPDSFVWHATSIELIRLPFASLLVQPAHVSVGETYNDLGAAGLNLGIKTFLNLTRTGHEPPAVAVLYRIDTRPIRPQPIGDGSLRGSNGNAVRATRPTPQLPPQL